MTYPAQTDKLGDLAVAIKNLAEYADARLPSLGVEVIHTGPIRTNASGDIAVQFQTITNVQCIIQSCTVVPTAGLSPAPTSVNSLQTPTWAILSGSPADTIWARCVVFMPTTGGIWVNCTLYGWGTPK